MEEVVETMLYEYMQAASRAKDDSRVSNNNITYWKSKILVLEELKKRCIWKMRTLEDYEL